MKDVLVKILVWVINLIVFGLGSLIYFVPTPNNFFKFLVVSIVSGFFSTFFYVLVGYVRTRIRMQYELREFIRKNDKGATK